MSYRTELAILTPGRRLLHLEWPNDHFIYPSYGRRGQKYLDSRNANTAKWNELCSTLSVNITKSPEYLFQSPTNFVSSHLWLVLQQILLHQPENPINAVLESNNQLCITQPPWCFPFMMGFLNPFRGKMSNCWHASGLCGHGHTEYGSQRGVPL